MTSSKSTKRALISGALSLLMCVAMLIGTTFAWFTDTASTAVNKIQSGTLDVALEMSTDGINWETAEGKTLTFKTADNRAAGKILWEPGCTYELPQLRVVNNGNLALKYKIQITGIQGNAKLNEVIDWTIDDAAINLTEVNLPAGQTGAAFTIKGHMQETAGNDYQGLTIDGIGITVVATQDTVEKDSNSDQYDKDATYPVLNAEEFSAAMQEAQDGDVITLGDTMDFSNETVTIDKNITISGEDEAVKNAYFAVADGKEVVFDGVTVSDTTTIRAEDDAKMSFVDCTFEVTPEKKNGNGRAAAIIGNHQYSNVDLTLEGCTFNYNFSSADTYNMAVFMWSNVENVLIKNCVFNDYGFVAVKFLEMKAGANIVFEGNTFNMSSRSAANWYYNTAVQIHSVNQPTGMCNVSFVNNTFTGDFQTGAESEWTGYEQSSAPIVAELNWNAAQGLNNTTLTISGNTVNGAPVTADNFAFLKGANSSVIEQ